MVLDTIPWITIMSHSKHVCVQCRSVNKPCAHEKILLDYRWRSPKKTNNVAWKRIENGEWLWDRNYISKKATAWKYKAFLRSQKIKQKVRNNRQKVLASKEACEQKIDQFHFEQFGRITRSRRKRNSKNGRKIN